MPERQSTPGGATAEQDAESEPRGPAADPTPVHPAGPDEERTRPVARGAGTATVNLPRGDRAIAIPNGPASAPADDHPNVDGHAPAPAQAYGHVTWPPAAHAATPASSTAHDHAAARTA